MKVVTKKATLLETMELTSELAKVKEELAGLKSIVSKLVRMLMIRTNYKFQLTNCLKYHFFEY
ncbi:hypothetical protein [Pedobacter alluvionis]|uniref:Uncharacterized protein n=1 Tax=Pedobacter alluvionis TaxID=475253 RepID=A0A497YA56_9SPHI|nr:hypothetical protein [Pedobacter alluvionis]RLJ77139.1 hypothetical protein BCL90_2210 [Pedobacter alluvionis]TFB33623.1 hypothetical protein E3V97_06155 [Pedobacter alluvionis]